MTASIAVPLAIALALGRTDLLSAAVFGALGAVYGKGSLPSARAVRQSVVGALMVLTVGIGVVAGAPSAPTWAPYLVIGGASAVGCLLTRVTGWLPIPSLFLVFAVGTVMAEGAPIDHVGSALAVAGASALLAVGVGAVVGAVQGPEGLTADGRDDRGLEREAPGAAATMVGMHALVPPLAALLAVGIGIGHPFWAAVAATVPLAGLSSAERTARASQRAMGTVGGALLAGAVLAADLPWWALVLVVATCQAVTELFVRRSYAIAVVAITPMALILSDLGAGGASPRPLLIDRLLGTGLGLAVALLLLGLSTRVAQRGRDVAG